MTRPNLEKDKLQIFYIAEFSPSYRLLEPLVVLERRGVQCRGNVLPAEAAVHVVLVHQVDVAQHLAVASF